MSNDKPFIAVEADLQLAMRIAALARPEFPERFADLLKELIELAREQGYKAAQAQTVVHIDGRGTDPAELADIIQRISVGSGESKADQQPQNGEQVIRPLVSIDEARARHRAAHPAPPERVKTIADAARKLAPKKQKDEQHDEPLLRGQLNETEKRNIRRRYKLIQGKGDEAEKAWFSHVAKEYKKSIQYIYRIIYSDPEFEAIPPNPPEPRGPGGISPQEV